MKYIPLRNKYKQIAAYAIVDDEDFERLSQWKWYKHSHGYVCREKYIKSSKKSIRLWMHIEIMKHWNKYEINKQVDHINRNKSDNQKFNIRMATATQNCMNRGKQINSTTNYKGIIFEKRSKKNPWVARIPINGKLTHIGAYPTVIKAARAYDDKAKELYGEFAGLNFG